MKYYENTPKIKPSENEFLVGILRQHFILGLVIDGYSYYIDQEESDENSNTILYAQDGKLLSDNYFATDDLMKNIEMVYLNEVQPEYIADFVKENMNLLEESGYFE